MTRSVLIALGLALLVPFATLGAIAFAPESVLQTVFSSPFQLKIAQTTVVQVVGQESGEVAASVWSGVWTFAIIGELILLSIASIRPLSDEENNGVVYNRAP